MVRFSDVTRYLSFQERVQFGSRAHPASSSVDAEDFFPEDENDGIEVDHSVYIVQMLRLLGATSPLPYRGADKSLD